ncbi:MAG: hypothetical protein ACRENX_09885 [Candidatus Dormibacteria bacterium]
MANDIDGYGFAAQGRTIARLVADIRELDMTAIERVARGWDRHVGDSQMDQFRAAEQSASEVLEASDRVSQWHEVRTSLLELTEGKAALVSWKAEHGEVGAKAERAVLAAGLGLIADQDGDQPDLVILLRPLAEALPWLVISADGALGGE